MSEGTSGKRNTSKGAPAMRREQTRKRVEDGAGNERAALMRKKEKANALAIRIHPDLNKIHLILCSNKLMGKI